MPDYEYDLVVIGSGPAGESAAVNAIKHDKRVAIIDDKESPGGNCTHVGTIPSKALRSAVNSYLRYQENPITPELKLGQRVQYQDLLKNVSDVIKKQVSMRSRFYTRNQVRYYYGEASFISKNELRIRADGKTSNQITAKDIIIATGSRPYRPADIDFTHQRVFDSDTILHMPFTPRRLIIYGAGVIGCEYASIFSSLGIKVDLINTRSRLLEFLDDEISDSIFYHMMNRGVTIRHQETFQSLETRDDGVCLNLESGKSIRADAILWCNGRTGNTDTLNLDSVGIKANHRGQLEVDKGYQTNVENIYAVGDVVGWPSLASAAYNQGVAAADTAILGDKTHYVDDVPTGIYTIPEISSVGKTERELTAAKVPYEVGRAFFKDTARGQISGQSQGMLKILFHAHDHSILGVHCFGREATEIIHIGQAIMKQKGKANSIHYFINNTFNYPTMAEAYRIAAFNGLNRLK
ncbi:Soluble pyridine nucleotide transhydrogenase [BD1-7 clade bacterium]|uniref:Soluble pyridine nucleotide transhydrogenase n=1 Tax=BD1-7 clade bacterium TaxID=2029982 RepID=A0A5S9MSZ7_9GAMM|nr:Soluble pyridine nucleotide transhydrogenase [BD1-7 clade bacterium]CAA0084888.1 Soluble pyridine nucleotide transhydrogenase [BD1-7 clade bacterium]